MQNVKNFHEVYLKKGKKLKCEVQDILKVQETQMIFELKTKTLGSKSIFAKLAYFSYPKLNPQIDK
jgi:hypothetical protein